MRHAMSKAILAVSTAAAVSICSMTWASAPNDQIITDTAFPAPSTLYSVVDILNSYNRDGTYTDIGTGSVIAKEDAGNGDGILYILTANHVVTAGAKDIAFGSGSTFPASSVFGISNPLQYLNEDIDLVQATLNIGFASKPGQDRTLFNSITPITVSDPTTRPLQVNDPFTQYGYGNTGTAGNYTYPVNNLPYPGYQEAASAGVKRFENNTVEALYPQSVATYNAAYTQPSVEFNVGAPPNISGGGAAFPGDSGGPLLTSYPNSAATDRGDMSVLTDFQSAVLVAGTFVGTAPNLITFNQYDDTAVPIDAGLYNFLTTNAPIPTPEPAALALMGIGGAALLLVRRRRKTGSD